jgi:hypothetical protein
MNAAGVAALNGGDVLRASSKSKRMWLVCVTAGLLLFTQLAMAAQACMLMKSGPASQEMVMAECDGVPMDKGVCLARCLAGDQVSVSPDHHAQFTLSSASTGQAGFAPAENRVSSAHVAAFHISHGPPLRIIFCSYQI